MVNICDSYPESNRNSQMYLTATVSKLGQSFTGNGELLSSAKFYLFKTNTPTGTANAKIYAHSGTFGSSSKPTGSPLAVSDNFDVSQITTSWALYEFIFSGANQITLVNGTKYVLTIEWNGGIDTPLSHWVGSGLDSTSPTHSGNVSRYTTLWTAYANYDEIFYVYTSTPPPSGTQNIMTMGMG